MGTGSECTNRELTGDLTMYFITSVFWGAFRISAVSVYSYLLSSYILSWVFCCI